MSIVSALDAIKAFLEEHVTPTIQLQVPSDDNIYRYELTNPSVHIGWIPPKGFLPDELEPVVPCLVVGLDDSTDDGSDVEHAIRISAVVYSPGLHRVTPEGESIFTPDFQGYRDLLNLLERTSAALLKHQVIGNTVSLRLPVNIGMYQEVQPYPYWYGWITFSVRQASYPASELAKYL